MESQKWSTDLGAQSAQQLKIAVMSFDEQESLLPQPSEDLEQNTTDFPCDVMQ